MKTIGLIGGMSWESTAYYYHHLNTGVKEALGGYHSAKVALFSVEFSEIHHLQHSGDWDGTTAILVDAARKVEAAGADFLLICTNTMHKVALQVQAAVDIPLLHLADATAQVLVDDGIQKVALLGTGFTMAQDFYKGRLRDNFGLDVRVPNEADQKIVHDIIYNELCLGEVKDASRQEYLRIIDQLVADGAEAVILGCTEICMLIEQQHTSAKLFDTTAIHADAAVRKALEE